MKQTFIRWIEDYQTGGYIGLRECSNECGKIITGYVRGQDLFQYNNGALAQVAFPYLSADDREALFMSGCCGTCFDKIMSDPEDEKYDGAVDLVRMVQMFAPDEDARQIVHDLFDTMVNEDSTPEAAMIAFSGILNDGLRHGNWPWVKTAGN